MKIVHVITRSDAVGGAHVHVRDLSAALVAHGHEVTVLAGGDGPFIAHLREKGIPCYSLRHLVRPIRPGRDLAAVAELRRKLASLKPDLVSTHSSKAGWIGRVAARTLGLPVVFTVHGWAFTEGVAERERWVYVVAERLAAPFADRLITVSEYDRQLALRYRLAPPDKLVTVHNGVPDVDRGLRARPGVQPPRIVMVARFEPPKDPATLLMALAGLRDTPWGLELIGDGPSLREMRELASSLDIADRIEFAGARHDVAERLATAQVFVLVSRWEGLPLTILEAMRAGLPVVASDVGGVREAVLEGETGFLVPRGNVDILRERLRFVLERPEVRVRMGVAGRGRYEANFTFERMFQKTLAVYREILDAPQGRRHRGDLGA